MQTTSNDFFSQDNLARLAVDIHAANVAKGFWPEGRDLREVQMLIICEMAEAIEAEREGRRANITAFRYDIDMAGIDEQLSFKEHIKDTFEDELADIAIRCLDLAGHLKEVDFFKYFYGNKMSLITKKSFCALAWEIVYFSDSIDNELDYVICLKQIIAYCQLHDIDLQFHIEQKLKYNATRPAKHGKAY